MFALGLKYFNTGMRAMITMAVQYMFKEIYQIPLMQSSAYISYINLPWTPKLLYGIITDVFPICGSGKRSYVILMGMLQSLFHALQLLLVARTLKTKCGLCCLRAWIRWVAHSWMWSSTASWWSTRVKTQLRAARSFKLIPGASTEPAESLAASFAATSSVQWQTLVLAFTSWPPSVHL